MDKLSQLEATHAQESKVLEVELDKLRKTLDKKADKAKKKSVTSKIELMKRELEIRQEEERYKLNLDLQEEDGSYAIPVRNQTCSGLSSLIDSF